MKFSEGNLVVYQLLSMTISAVRDLGLEPLGLTFFGNTLTMTCEPAIEGEPNLEALAEEVALRLPLPSPSCRLTAGEDGRIIYIVVQILR